jgi:quercetin dioxygenase-like cupin family protein
MQKTSLTALSRELLEDALRSSSGRSSRTVFGGHERVLRQTVITLAAGQEMSEHVSPGEATIYVLRGRVTLTAGETSWHGMAGDHLIIPELPHGVEAIEDSAILLTVAKLP